MLQMGGAQIHVQRNTSKNIMGNSYSHVHKVFTNVVVVVNFLVIAMKSETTLHHDQDLNLLLTYNV